MGGGFNDWNHWILYDMGESIKSHPQLILEYEEGEERIGKIFSMLFGCKMMIYFIVKW